MELLQLQWFGALCLFPFSGAWFGAHHKGFDGSWLEGLGWGTTKGQPCRVPCAQRPLWAGAAFPSPLHCEL